MPFLPHLDSYHTHMHIRRRINALSWWVWGVQVFSVPFLPFRCLLPFRMLTTFLPGMPSHYSWDFWGGTLLPLPLHYYRLHTAHTTLGLTGEQAGGRAGGRLTLLSHPIHHSQCNGVSTITNVVA